MELNRINQKIKRNKTTKEGKNVLIIASFQCFRVCEIIFNYLENKKTSN